MTVRAVAGLIVFNVLVTAIGAGVLRALCPATTVRRVVRLLGLAYVLGVAALMVALTLLLVVGLPVTKWSIATTAIAIFLLGEAIARRRGRAEPGPAGPATLDLSLPAAAVAALIVVTLEAVFRRGRLQALLGFDEWDSWAPKVKELFYTGHLPAEFLAPLPGGSYPPGLPAVLSAALHAIGSADVVTLHLQYWFFAAGFVSALWGLLADRVRPLVLLPFLLFVFVMPDIRNRSVDMYGDLPLGYFLAIGAVLVALWVMESRRWQLEMAALVFAGAAVTKREGILLVGCVLVAGSLASSDRLKQVWPRLALAFVPALAVWTAWYVWLRAQGLPGNGPATGLHFLTDAGRGWDSLVVVTKNLFNYELWLIAATIAVAAACLGVLGRAWRLAVFLGGLVTICLLGCAVTIWSDPNIVLQDVNLVSRLVGTVALTAVAVTPLMLRRVWDAGAPLSLPEDARRTHPGWAAALGAGIVAACAIAYPAAVVAGGAPRFPGRFDCGTATAVGPPVVVFGHEPSYPTAIGLRDRVAAAGFSSTTVGRDDCGAVRVYIADVPSQEAAESLVRRAKAAGLPATVERERTGNGS